METTANEVEQHNRSSPLMEPRAKAVIFQYFYFQMQQQNTFEKPAPPQRVQASMLHIFMAWIGHTETSTVIIKPIEHGDNVQPLTTLQQ